MDVIFEGRLSQEVSIRQVLQQIFDQAHAGRTILRLTALKGGDDFTGRILLSDGRHIVAASVGENRILGYPALKATLDRLDCSFALLRVSPNDNLDLGTTLNIDLQRIITLLPNLPDSPAGLFDEKGLLDKLFGDFDDVPQGPSQPKLGPPATIIQSATTQKAAFNMLEPFLSGGYPAAGEEDFEDDFEDDEQDKSARDRQRAQKRHRERSQYYRDDDRDDESDGDDYDDDDAEMDFSPQKVTPMTPFPPVRSVSPQAVQENSSRLRQLAQPPKRGVRIPYVPAAGAFVIYMLTSLILAYVRPGFAESFSWSYSWATAMWDYLAPARTNVKRQTLAPSPHKLSWKVNNARIRS